MGFVSLFVDQIRQRKSLIAIGSQCFRDKIVEMFQRQRFKNDVLNWSFAGNFSQYLRQRMLLIYFIVAISAYEKQIEIVRLRDQAFDQF